MKIVLVNPEIPHNTGAIGRTCVALDLELILIKPLGFSIDDTSVARAGTRYWKYVNISQYEDWNDFINTRKPPKEDIFFSHVLKSGSICGRSDVRSEYLSKSKKIELGI